MKHTDKPPTPDTWQRLSASSSREGGEQEAAHGDQAQDYTAVLPGIVHTLLQQLEDPLRPVHTQRPAQRRRAQVESGHTDHHLAGQSWGDHGGKMTQSAGNKVSPVSAGSVHFGVSVCD